MKKSDKLIVLDLDETLFHCTTQNIFDNPDYIITFSDAPEIFYYTKLRPHLNNFLKYIKDNFRYGIYTAADREYALEHIKRLDLNPEFLLSYTNCTPKKALSIAEVY